MKKHNLVLSLGMLLGILMSTFFVGVSSALELNDSLSYENINLLSDNYSSTLCGPPEDGKVWVVYGVGQEENIENLNTILKLCIQQDKNKRNLTFDELIQGGIISGDVIETDQDVKKIEIFYLGGEISWSSPEVHPTDAADVVYSSAPITGGGEAYLTYGYHFDTDGSDNWVIVFIERGKISTKLEWCKLKPDDFKCKEFLREGSASISVEGCEQMKQAYSFPDCQTHVDKILSQIDGSSSSASIEGTGPILEIVNYFEQGVSGGGVSSEAGTYDNISRDDIDALMQCTNIKYTECMRNAGVTVGKEVKDAEDMKVSIPSVAGLNKMGSTNIPQIIGRAIKGVLSIMGSIAFAMYMYGGVLFMTAAGNASKEEKAKKVLVWTTLGLVVILASYIIVDFIFEAFR
ncbi:MAG: pilin [Candidatus Magasanikbacteria bacterium]